MAAIHARQGGAPQGPPGGPPAGLPGQMPGGGIGGAAPAQAPPPNPIAATGIGSGGDKANVEKVIAVLHAAIAGAQDAQLKATYASALQALTKYLATDEKETHAAMGGKLSPKIMARAYGRSG